MTRRLFLSVSFAMAAHAGRAGGAADEINIESLPLTEFHPTAPSPDGPTFDRQGRLFFTSGGSLIRTDALGNLLQRIVTGGNPIGTTLLANGNLACTDAGQGSILEVRTDGFFKVALNQFNGQRLPGPTDLVAHRDGRIYFTDYDAGDAGDPGRVFLLRPSGKADLFQEGLDRPTGIALSSDGKELFVSESGSGKIYRYTMTPEGLMAGRTEFAILPGGGGYEPRGVRFDVFGNLWIAYHGKGVIAAVNTSGKLVRFIDAGGKFPTNLAFQGNNLYVTEAEKERVVRIELGIRGQRVPAG